MIAQNHKISKHSLIYNYDKEYDILNVYLYKNPAVSEEIADGIYEHFDRATDKLLGVSIENYKLRNQSELDKLLPFKLNYDYINKKFITENVLA